MKRLIIIVALGLLVGCSPIPGSRNVHHRREVVLSRQTPENDFLRARLVAIAEDGTTTIQSIETGDVLRAAPGEYFAPGPFGAHGLQLISASAEKQEALLLQRWADSK